MHGVVLIDKHEGVSSHYIVNRLRKIFNTKKIGHAGTLDPAASGLLLCCVGKATKISGYIMGQDKVYTVDVVLGYTSNTYDLEGEIQATQNPLPDRTLIEDALTSFKGEIMQRPPIYCAIKKDGKKLYQYARQGIEVEVPMRRVRIDDIKIQSWEPSTGILKLYIQCSKGTYIRSVAHDLGQDLGCGGYARHIRRLKSGSFDIDRAITLDTLQVDESNRTSKHLVPIKDALTGNAFMIEINEEQAQWIRHGKSIEPFQKYIKGEGLYLFHLKTCEPIALATSEINTLTLKRVF